MIFNSVFEQAELNNIINSSTPVIWTGINAPGELERHSEMWVTKAGARNFPSGFKYDSKTNIHWEWGAVLEGEFIFEYKNRVFKVSSGMSYIMAPDITLKAESINNPLLVWVEINGTIAAEALKKLGGKYGEVTITRFTPEQVCSVLKIANLLHEHPYGYELLVHSNLWFFLANSINPKNNSARTISSEIQDILDFINSQNIVDNYTLSQLAQISRMPLETFRKRFSADVGESPIKYMLKRKIKRAKELLSNKDFNIQQISLQTGFQDQYYFSRIFRKYEGLSPTEFRKRFFPELYF